MVSTGLLAVAPIPVGDHVVVHVFGVAFDADTIWTSLIAGAVVMGLGFYLRAKVTAGVPSKVQVFWEVLVGWVSDQVEAGLGPGTATWCLSRLPSSYWSWRRTGSRCSLAFGTTPTTCLPRLLT